MSRKSPSALRDPTAVGAGEMKKSTATRRRIMEAAVHCLAHEGYAGTNTGAVAERANMLRSALLYHFPTRLALLEAVIHFVTRERIALFEQALASIADEPGRLSRAIDLAWAQNHTIEYRAFGELANAARTDPELAAIFAPAMDEYDRARRASAMTLFSAAEQAAPGFHLRRDITRFLLDGVASYGWISEDADARIAMMIEFLKALAIEPEGSALLRKTVARAARSAAKPARRRPKK